MQTTAIRTVANSLPEKGVILLTLLISDRYILFAELFHIYVADCFSDSETNKEIVAFIERHFSLLSKVDFIDKVYSRYAENSKEIGSLIKACCLFSPSHVLSIAKSNFHLAVSLLDAKKDYYKKEDLELMKQILTTFESLPKYRKNRNGKRWFVK